MNVLLITPWYPYSKLAAKGIFIKKHVHAIKSAGINIEVLALIIDSSSSFYHVNVVQSVDEAGVKTHLIELSSLFSKLVYANIYQLNRIIRNYYLQNIALEFTPDIIHSNVVYPTGVIGDMLAELTNSKLIITEHWSKIDLFMNRPVLSGLARKAYNDAVAISVVSDFLKKKVIRYVQDQNKIVIIPNVIDTEIFNSKGPRILSNDQIIFICAANMRPPKRPDLIFNSLEALSKLISSKIVLNVIGDGPLLQNLKSAHWSFDVNFLGFIDQKSMVAAYHSSMFFLHASDFETFSIVIAEAHASGLPVLASDVAAIPELINPSNGMVCSNTIDAWTKALIELIARNYNETEIRVSALKFNEKDIGKEFVSMYTKALMK